MGMFVLQYDKWIMREAWRFVLRHGEVKNADDYIQTAREAALRICKRKGYTTDNLTALTMCEIRMAIHHDLYAAYSKKDGVGLNSYSMRTHHVKIEYLQNEEYYEHIQDDNPDNSTLWSLQAMVNEEWRQILQEIADGYRLKEISEERGMSPSVLKNSLKKIGEMMEYGRSIPEPMRRIP